MFVQRFYGTNKRQGNFWWPRILIGVLFLVIILIFLSLYSSGNAIFASATQGFWNRIETLLKDLNGPLIFTCIAGLFIANWVIFRNQSPAHDRWLAKSLSMIRTKGNPENTGLRSSLRFEYRTGIVLFALLNGLLLLLNLADIWLVWLGFEWKGQLLKDFYFFGDNAVLFPRQNCIDDAQPHITEPVLYLDCTKPIFGREPYDTKWPIHLTLRFGI
jgi:hypothetical protein